jgi:hypothetical protein
LLAAPAQEDSVPSDPRQIILRSAVFEARDLDRIRNYTFHHHKEERKLDAAGRPAKIERTTHEVLVLYGRPYRRLIAENGKPLPEKEEAEEQKKLEKEMNRRRNQSEKERQKAREEDEKELEEAREFRREVADAFHFKLLGEETVGGYPAWVIQAEPRADYKARSGEGKLLRKMRGKLWVSRQDYRWVKIEAEVVETISLGWVVARLYPGTRLTFEAVKVNDEVWVPGRGHIRANGRIALLKKINAEVDLRWDNYRKFQADSRVISVTDLP